MRTLQELKMLQALPLEVKVKKTQQRIKEFVDVYGIDGVYVSFSGGKDSTVLLHIARELYPTIPAAFANTGLEYPEIVAFVKSHDNVDIVRPSMNFKAVINEYGYPFISKEVSFALDGARRFLDNREEYKDKKPLPVQAQTDTYKPYALLRLEGKIGKTGKGYSQFNCERYAFMLNAPYHFSAKCCNIMKKEPFARYGKETGRHPITAQMAEESRLRKKTWLQHGCNAFETRKPISNPMSFWTEQDVLQYIKKNNIEICSVYGDIVHVDEDGMEYETTICDMPLKTTGLRRTGCMFCGYGCQREEDGSGRFEIMKDTHPKIYDYIMRPQNRGG